MSNTSIFPAAIPIYQIFHTFFQLSMVDTSPTILVTFPISPLPLFLKESLDSILLNFLVYLMFLMLCSHDQECQIRNDMSLWDVQYAQGL